ncbi:PA14 domain-containing protein [Acidovorax sp.]|uniref:PA14 domain-containing protein n=1 Tax=Acidovorax sp. TaxID=1872122 RepID=UPI00391F04C6
MTALDAAAPGRALTTCLRRWLAASLLLLGASQAMAQPQCTPGQWLAEYFPNIHLSGAPALQRCEAGPIDHYWTGRNGSPDPAKLPVDGFSARWTATLAFPGGATRFITFTDDGVRVSVDGQRVIDNWTRHGITMDSATVPLAAGPHTVLME